MKKPKSAKNLFYAAFVLMIVAVSWGILAPYIKGLLKNRMLEQSEITQDATYESYQQYKQSGILTQEGYYSGAVTGAGDPTTTRPDGAVKITFASNSNLSVKYFSDADKTQPIEGISSFLNPQDCLYASVSLSNNLKENAYTFLGFRIYQYENGTRTFINTITPDESGLVMSISSEYAGADLSVEPFGEYQPLVLSLRDYYTDENDREFDLSGTWIIDDRQITQNQAEISPLSSCVVSYKYDSSEYFYLSSSPQCYYNNNEDGVVIFELRESTDTITNYSIELHKYISVSIESDLTRSVSVNNGTRQEIPAGGALELSGLKYGDTITLVTNKEWQLENFRELILNSQEQFANGQYRYTLTVPQKGSEFVFDPSEYSYEHGTIIFKCFGEIVTGVQYLAPGSRIVYEQNSAEDGYWLPDREHVIIVGEEEETRRQLNCIRFIQRIPVTVELPQPEYGGTIYYSADGQELTEDSFQTFSGTKIEMRFENWEGWINHYNTGETYTVTEDSRQTIRIGTWSVNTAFSESPEHMPVLEVVLDKSVGEDMEFRFSASGLSEKVYQYESRWLRNSLTIISNHKIGTESGIAFSIGNHAIRSGTAVKVLIEKTDIDDNKSSGFRLIDSLTDIPEPILVYDEDDPGTSKIWYKSIKITISLVDVETFQPPAAPLHASVTVRNLSTQRLLKTGDLLEPSEEVTVTIFPSDGYYISGKSVRNDQYQETMRFSQYQSDIQTILEEHPVKQYYHVTLDSDDAYGTCIYQTNGENVTGTISVRDGQILTLKYEITAPGYIIEGAGGFPFGLWKNDQEQTADITLTENMNGQTINRETFGIVVVKEE